MIRDRTCVYLENEVFYQKSYDKLIIKALETHFQDNDLFFFLIFLNLYNIPSKKVNLASWEVTNLEVFLKLYEVQKKMG